MLLVLLNLLGNECGLQCDQNTIFVVFLNERIHESYKMMERWKKWNKHKAVLYATTYNVVLKEQ